MYILFLDGKPALHLVDLATRFSAAKLLQNVTTEYIWEFVLLCWSNIYVDLPHTFIVDPGNQFRKTFSDISTTVVVKVQCTGVEAHHSLNIGERLDQLFRSTYRQLHSLNTAVFHQGDTFHGNESFQLHYWSWRCNTQRTAILNISFGTDIVTTHMPKPMLTEIALLPHKAHKIMEQRLAQFRVDRALKHKCGEPITTSNRSGRILW